MGGLGIGIAPHEILQTVSLGGGPPPWTPADHPSTKVWLDASQITGLVDGNPVPLWEDLIGTIVGFDQATAAKRPTYRTGVQNGLPIVRFDGTDDYLHASAEFVNFQNPTIWAVIKTIDIDGWVYTDYRNSTTLLLLGTSGALMYMISQEPGVSLQPSAANAPTFTIYAGVIDGQTARIIRNEVETSDTDPAYTPNTWELTYLDTPTIGAYPNGLSSQLAGDIGEMIWCNNLAAGDRALFWTYLNNKWAVY